MQVIQQLTPQQALDNVNYLVVTAMGAGLFKDFQSLDAMRQSINTLQQAVDTVKNLPSPETKE